jgi:hypothetical protein
MAGRIDMRMTFVLISIALFFAIPTAISLVAIYRKSHPNRGPIALSLTVLGALAIHLCLSVVILWVNFIAVYTAAHAGPLIPEMPVTGILIYVGILMVYVVCGWLLCSWVNGGLIRSITLNKVSRLIRAV